MTSAAQTNTACPEPTPTSPQTGLDLVFGSVVMTNAVSGGVDYDCTKKARARA